MRAVYWLNDRIYDAWIWVGDWALKERHRPLIVSTSVFILIHFIAWGLLSLMELAFRR